MARTSQRQSNPGRPTANNAATRPANRVIGSTAARVTTIQRVTKSTGPSGGGVVVRRAYAQELSRERTVTSVMAPLLLLFSDRTAASIVAGARRSSAIRKKQE